MGLLTNAMTDGKAPRGGPTVESGGKSDDSGGGALSDLKKIRDKFRSDSKKPPSYHRGGKVRKTGLARLKKGERVLTKGQQDQIEKRMKSKGRGKSKGRRKSR